MRLIIYGEIILDRYFISTTKRKAPEFDIPIYNVNKIEDKLGGASNVAFNLNEYTDILFISVLGNDDISKTIIDILNTNNIKNKIFISNRKSIIKNRTICNKQRFNTQVYTNVINSLLVNPVKNVSDKLKRASNYEKYDTIIKDKLPDIPNIRN